MTKKNLPTHLKISIVGTLILGLNVNAVKADCWSIAFGYDYFNGYANHCDDLSNCDRLIKAYVNMSNAVQYPDGTWYRQSIGVISADDSHNDEPQYQYVEFDGNPIISVFFPYYGAPASYMNLIRESGLDSVEESHEGIEFDFSSNTYTAYTGPSRNGPWIKPQDPGEFYIEYYGSTCPLIGTDI